MGWWFRGCWVWKVLVWSLCIEVWWISLVVLLFMIGVWRVCRCVLICCWISLKFEVREKVVVKLFFFGNFLCLRIGLFCSGLFCIEGWIGLLLWIWVYCWDCVLWMIGGFWWICWVFVDCLLWFSGRWRSVLGYSWLVGCIWWLSVFLVYWVVVCLWCL